MYSKLRSPASPSTWAAKRPALYSALPVQQASTSAKKEQIRNQMRVLAEMRPNVLVSEISNIVTAFGSNTAVLAVVFLAVCLGLSMNALGEEKTATLRKLVQELNDVVVVFLNYVVNKFGPFAIFVLLVRTFATYGINHLRWRPPA